MTDFPKFCDAYICSASFDNGKELSYEELDQLEEQSPGFTNELIFDNQLYI